MTGPEGRSQLFVFPEARRWQPHVDEWLSGEPVGLFSIARYWFGRFRACGEDVTEIMHDGCPTACVDKAAFGYVNVFKSHVNVGFFTGAFLADPHNLLQGTGKRMRHVKVRPGQEVDEQAINALILAAYRDVQARLNP